MGGVQKDYGWAVAMLGGLASAAAVISLIQNGFEIRLNWGFSQFVDFYRQIVTPLIDIVQWPVHWALTPFDIRWTVPQWLKDVHALSFVLAGVYARGWILGAYAMDPVTRFLEDVRKRPPVPDPISHIVVTAVSIVLGATGMIFVVILLTIRRAATALRVESNVNYENRRTPWIRRPNPRETLTREGIALHQVDSLVRVTAATAAAVTAFYAGNAGVTIIPN